MKIDKNKIKAGIGAGLLVAALAAGGIAFSNGETPNQTLETAIEAFEETKDENTVSSDVTTASKDAEDLEKTNEALNATAPADAPIWFEPEIIEYNENQEAAKVPYGYALYQYKNDVSGILGVEVDDDTITYIGSDGKSLKGSFAVKREYFKVMQLMDSFIKSYKEGTANKELYVEPTKTVNEAGMNELRIPQGYRIFYVGDRNNQAGMTEVQFEKDGERLPIIESNPNLVLWDTEVIIIPEGYSTDYIGLEPKLHDAFKQVQSVKNEMETYYNGLQQKTIS